MCVCLQTVRVSLALLISAHSCGVWRDAEHWWADSCRYVTKPLLIPRFLHGVRAGSLLARCGHSVRVWAPGPIAGPRKMRQSCCGTLKFEEEKSLELRIDYPTFIWIYQQLLGSLWAPHIPPSLAALKKTLEEANTENPMGREWWIFMEHDLRGRIAFKGSIFIYRLTLFNKPSFYHCWIAIKIMIKIWI